MVMGGTRMTRRSQDCSVAMRGGPAIPRPIRGGDDGANAGAAYIFRDVNAGLAGHGTQEDQMVPQMP